MMIHDLFISLLNTLPETKFSIEKDEDNCLIITVVFDDTTITIDYDNDDPEMPLITLIINKRIAFSGEKKIEDIIQGIKITKARHEQRKQNT